MRNIRGSCLRIVSTAILDGGYYLFILQRWAGCYAVTAELESSLECQFFFWLQSHWAQSQVSRFYGRIGYRPRYRDTDSATQRTAPQ